MPDALLIRAAVFNLPAPGANTNILALSVTPTQGAVFRLTISLAVASVVNVTITDGVNTIVSALDNGRTIAASRMHTFVMDVNPVETNSGTETALLYNFQVAIDGIIQYFVVTEGQLGTT